MARAGARARFTVQFSEVSASIDAFHTHKEFFNQGNFEPSDPQPSSPGLYLLSRQESPQAPSPREGFWQATGR